MKQNRLFERSRWRLASWYAAILSIVLLICALGFYEAVAHAHHKRLSYLVADLLILCRIDKDTSPGVAPGARDVRGELSSIGDKLRKSTICQV